MGGGGGGGGGLVCLIMAMLTGACWGGHFYVEPGIFVSSRPFLCRTMHFAVEPGFLCRTSVIIKGLITVGRELRQQYPSDLLSGAGTSRERSHYNMTKQRYITRLYDKIHSKSPPNRATSPTCLHCDVTHLSGSCSFTHPIAKGRSARGTYCVAS